MVEIKKISKKNVNKVFPSLVLWTFNMFFTRTHANFWLFNLNASYY